jgi:hypothetical protein
VKTALEIPDRTLRRAKATAGQRGQAVIPDTNRGLPRKDGSVVAAEAPRPYVNAVMLRKRDG